MHTQSAPDTASMADAGAASDTSTGTNELPIKLILTDIDGTILPYGQDVISKRTAQAMQMCIDAGIHIGPASGRDMQGLGPIFGLNEALYATGLATNGMQIFLDGELIYESYIPYEQLVELYDFSKRYEDEGLGMVVFENENIYILSGTIPNLAKTFGPYAEIAQQIDKVPHFPVVKANIFCPPDDEFTVHILECARREVTSLDFSKPMPGFLNVTPQGWNKGAAIDVICDKLGISLDEVCCFGDAGNDIEMLAHVKYSVAVANATDEVKKVANYHIGSVEEEATAACFEQLAQGIIPFA